MSETARRARRPMRVAQRWLRRVMLAGVLTGLLGIVGLIVPQIAHGQTINLASYGAAASGAAIQPYILNDEFVNIPATDQAVPYVFTTIDNSPSARAKAAYFFPGTAINAVLTTENTGQQVPSGVEAGYPGNGAASEQVGPVSDGVASQAGAAAQSAKASEGSAEAQASLASYQFAPGPGVTPPGGIGPLPTLPPVPTLPPIPTIPVSPTNTPTPGSGSATPTATPGVAPSPSPTPCPLGICLTAPRTNATGQPQATGVNTPNIQLPDVITQNLATVLRLAETANPGLLQLAGGKLVTTDATLPYAAADVSGQSAANATDSGVTVMVQVRASRIELFQGLITFDSVTSILQGQAPASNANGSGAITTTIANARIAGIPVTIDQNGVQVDGQGSSMSAAALQQLSSALNSALQAAHVQIALTQSTGMRDIGKWQGSSAGLTVTALLDPGNGVPATHVNFMLGQVSGSVYAVPPVSSGGGDNGGGGDFGGQGSFFTNFFGNPSSNSNTPGHKGNGLFSLQGSLSPGELLALLFIVQGFATAAVAAAASNAEAVAKASQPLIEEETR